MFEANLRSYLSYTRQIKTVRLRLFKSLQLCTKHVNSIQVYSASQHLDSAEYSESTEVSVVSVSSSASSELHEGSGDDPPDPIPLNNNKVRFEIGFFYRNCSETEQEVYFSRSQLKLLVIFFL